jgi:hypothetical protein
MQRVLVAAPANWATPPEGECAKCTKKTIKPLLDMKGLGYHNTASHLPDKTAGIGTLTFVRLPRFQRAGPSASLDKSVAKLGFNFRVYITAVWKSQAGKQRENKGKGKGVFVSEKRREKRIIRFQPHP